MDALVRRLGRTACTQTLFYFSFGSFGKHRLALEQDEHASDASEGERARNARKKNKYKSPLDLFLITLARWTLRRK